MLAGQLTSTPSSFVAIRHPGIPMIFGRMIFEMIPHEQSHKKKMFEQEILDVKSLQLHLINVSGGQNLQETPTSYSISLPTP